jgi:hypothetical protein
MLVTSYYEVGYDPDFFLGVKFHTIVKVWNLFVANSFFFLNHKNLEKKKFN